MEKPVLQSKSLMLAPICDGDQVAAAILDYIYLYFQQPSPYELFFGKIQQQNKDSISNEFYEYLIQGGSAPFDLDVERYPETWLSITLAELHAAIDTQFSRKLEATDLLEGLKVLQNKGYMIIEDWGLFEEDGDGAQADYCGSSSPMITCWLYRGRVNYAVAKYYSNHLIILPIDTRIDVRREKRIVSNQVLRAKRIGQAASLTFEEWAETLRYFNLRCAFCQKAPYEVLEHFVPIIHGGSSSAFNCVPACETCNALKNERLPLEFAQVLGQDHIHTIQHYLEQRRLQWLKKRQKN